MAEQYNGASSEEISFPQPALYIDLLGTKLGLTAEQISDLHTIVAFGEGLSPGNLLLRIYEIAQTFKTHNLLEKLLNKDSALDNVVNDMRDLITVKWSLNNMQKKAINMEARKAVWSATTMSYMNLDQDAKAKLQGKAKSYGLEPVFDNDVRYATLSSEVRTTCTAIRNQYRAALKDSVFGDSRASLSETCLDLGKKFGLLKEHETVPAENQVRVALLRRFVYENPDAVNHIDTLPDSEAVDDAVEDTPTNSRKRRRSGRTKSKEVGRRPAKGKDFWSLVDAWFQEHAKKWGTDLGGPEWKLYLEETLQKDANQSVGVRFSFNSLLNIGHSDRQATPQSSEQSPSTALAPSSMSLPGSRTTSAMPVQRAGTPYSRYVTSSPAAACTSIATPSQRPRSPQTPTPMYAGPLGMSALSAYHGGSPASSIHGSHHSSDDLYFQGPSRNITRSAVQHGDLDSLNTYARPFSVDRTYRSNTSSTGLHLDAGLSAEGHGTRQEDFGGSRFGPGNGMGGRQPRAGPHRAW